MDEFYLSNLLLAEKDADELIIDILNARGFLFDHVDGHYYLSDNATVNDAEYLSKSISEYNLGFIVDNKDYIKKRRRNWYKDSLSRTYEYNSVKPCTIEVVINKKASINSAISFFNSTKRFSEECVTWRLSWHQYAIELLGPKADVSHLEPYVAYYVKAVSSCGVYTNRSCDGNHPNGGRIYVDSDYPSNIWHLNIWKYIVQPRFGMIPYIGEGIKLNAQNQQEIYSQIYEIADYLYKNRYEIRKMKQNTLEHFDKKFIRKHNENDLEAFYRTECKRILQSDDNCLNQ